MTRFSGHSDKQLLQRSVSGALVAAGLNLVVPRDENWQVSAITVLLTTTATVGNRLVTVELLDSDGNPLAIVVHGQTVAASKVISVNLGLGGYGQSAAGTSPLSSSWDGMPTLVALSGQRFRVKDQAGVDVTDSAVVTFHGDMEPTD